VISLEPAVRENVDAIFEILDACGELWAILIDPSSAVGPRLIPCVAREVEEFPTHNHAAHRAFLSHNPFLETYGGGPALLWLKHRVQFKFLGPTKHRIQYPYDFESNGDSRSSRRCSAPTVGITAFGTVWLHTSRGYYAL
jgi:hypothetical protein